MLLIFQLITAIFATTKKWLLGNIIGKLELHPQPNSPGHPRKPRKFMLVIPEITVGKNQAE